MTQVTHDSVLAMQSLTLTLCMYNQAPTIFQSTAADGRESWIPFEAVFTDFCVTNNNNNNFLIIIIITIIITF